MKKIIKLNESDIRRIVKESVRSILTEGLSPFFSKIAKKHGGVKWVDKNYQLDKLQVNGRDDNNFVETNVNDVPYRLLKFTDEIMKFNDGTSLLAIKPEFGGNKNIIQMLKSSKELTNSRTAEGGYQPDKEWDEIEVDYGDGGPYYKSYKKVISPEEIRQRSHKKARGIKKPLPNSNDSHDYDEYVRKYLCNKLNGIDLKKYIAIPVDNRHYGDDNDMANMTCEKYGYIDDNTVSRYELERDVERLYGDNLLDDNLDYLIFSRNGQGGFVADHEREPKKTHKIGTSGFNSGEGLWWPQWLASRPTPEWA